MSDYDAASPAVPAGVHAAEDFDPSASAGLFVGVSSFKDPGFVPVPYAVDDAVDLAHLFALELRLVEPAKVILALAGEPVKEASGERLQILLDAGVRREDAEQTDIYSFLDEQAKASGKRGLFVASIATHGFSDQGGDFLVASDSLRRRIVRTGVAVDELFDDVARSSSPRRLVLLDACRERLTADTRATGETASAMSDGFARAIAEAEGQVVLAGATLGGYAYDDLKLQNGVFTAALIDGLRGAAGVDERGYVTVRTLADYADARVAAWVREKLPDHASRSQGIARRIEGAVEGLPLAVDPGRLAAIEAYLVRREAAIVRLRENLGRKITGALYDEIVACLPEGGPRSGVEELLEEIEFLDGTVQMKRSLVLFFDEYRSSQPSEPAPRPKKSASKGRKKSSGSNFAPGEERMNEKDGSVLVYVPGGEFTLGTNEDLKAYNKGNEGWPKPEHRVHLSAHWIGKYPVTNAQYRRFLEGNPGQTEPEQWHDKQFNGPEQPVVGVSWFEAMAYCRWAGLELPSEAQWEAAARGTEGRRYPWGDADPTRELANFDRNEGATTPVGAYPKGAGPYGTLDQSGNVWEWCRDEFAEDAYRDRDGKKDPAVLGEDDNDDSADRVLRGGSWAYVAWFLPSAVRLRFRAGDRSLYVGFRVLCGSVPEP